MKTFSFSEFAEKKDTERLIKESAQIISEMSAEPEEILSNIIEGLDESLVNTVWQGVKGAFSGGAQGVSKGAQQWRQESRLANDQKSGAGAKFDQASKILQDLVGELAKNPATGNVALRRLGGAKASDFIQNILGELQKAKLAMPELDAASGQYLRRSQIARSQARAGQPVQQKAAAAAPQPGAQRPQAAQPRPQAAAQRPQAGASGLTLDPQLGVSG